MAGGTDFKNHSEVGSSYIHFNFTPNQDKATPSLIGDVPGGVMLNQRPIFLGGQGGMVGPVRLNFGTTVAAGTILRRDELRPGRLIFGGAGKGGNIEHRPGRYSGASRIIQNNLFYIANLLALKQWYREVRSLFVAEAFSEALWKGLLSNIQSAMAERLRRLKEFASKMEAGGDSTLVKAWPLVEESLLSRAEQAGNRQLREAFLEKMNAAITRTGKHYITAVKALGTEDTAQGTAWLQGIVGDAVAEALKAAGNVGS
jgi:UDP-N-acetylglucosamine/UDP-N-acetylgalactosamine diphosphorylase